MRGDEALVDELFHPDFEGHDPDYPVHGTGQLKEAVRLSRGALDDVTLEYGQFIEVGDRVGVAWTVRARQVGVYAGLPPTGKPIQFHGTIIFRIVDGRFKEGWQTVDMSSVMRDSGVGASVPGPPRSTPPDWAERWGLAPRHVPIARLMIEGLTDGEIALHAGLSQSSVRTYAREILRAAGVSSRVELARACGAHHVG